MSPLLRRLREALRAELSAHHDGRADEGAGRVIDDVVSRYALGTVLTLVHVEQWMRVRVCPADDCLEAFHDSSRGGTRRRCAMGVCGNRAKVKAYRDRGAAS